MFNRIKKIWNLSGQSDVIVVKKSAMEANEARKLAAMTGKVVVFAEDVNDIKVVSKDDVMGDGKAEFLGEGTVDEFNKSEQKQSGMDKWIDRLKNLV